MTDDELTRSSESGRAFYKGPGNKHASVPKSKDGDESQAMAAVMGNGSGSWASMLNDGSDNPYPTTAQALKTKNTRNNNDSFR